MKKYKPVRRQQQRKLRNAAMIFLNLAIWTWVFAVIAAPTEAEKAARPYVPLVEMQAPVARMEDENAVPAKKTANAGDVEGVSWRTITAYNVGDPAQTDSTPCVGAAGSAYDLCEMVAAGAKVVATNEIPLFSKVVIGGETYTVLDRTNARYGYRYDIAMPKDQKVVALAFGRQTMAVQPLGINAI